MEIPEFYAKDSIEDWQRIIGNDLHYHFGHFNKETDEFQTALQQTIRFFYNDIPQGATLLDLGCGWGGPATVLEKERGCRVTCVTNTPAQIHYLKEILGKKDVHLLELEKGLPLTGHWDVAWMMESLEHIRNKDELLHDIRSLADTLIIRTSATRLEESEKSPTFGGSMHMVSQKTLVDMLSRAGWKIEKISDTRRASWPTLLHWKSNLDKHFPGNIPPGQFRALNALCNLGILQKDRWIWSSPLLNIVARRN